MQHKCEQNWPDNVGGVVEPLLGLKITLEEATPFADHVTRKMRVEMVSMTTPTDAIATSLTLSRLEVHLCQCPTISMRVGQILGYPLLPPPSLTLPDMFIGAMVHPAHPFWCVVVMVTVVDRRPLSPACVWWAWQIKWEIWRSVLATV